MSSPDSVAYLVAGALGVDTLAASFAYVTGWSGGDPQAVFDVAGRVTAAAGAILDALTVSRAGDLAEESPIPY